MTDTQDLTPNQELIVKLRNREKLIEMMVEEIKMLKNGFLKDEDESALVKSLRLDVKEFKQQVADLEEKYRQTIRFTKGERKEIQRDEQVARLTLQLQTSETKNNRLLKEQENLINKYYAPLNRDQANNI